MRIEKSGFYKQRDGGKAEVLAIRGERAFGIDSNNDACSWDLDGDCRDYREYDDLVSRWQNEPEYWVNRYEDGLSANYKSRKIAVNAASKSSRTVISTHRVRPIGGKLVDVTDEVSNAL